MLALARTGTHSDLLAEMNRKEVKDLMNENSRTDWKRVLNMTDAEVTANALKDPDNLPLPPTGGTKEIHLSEEDGATLLERFRKALERERKVLISVRYDADIVRWYKAKGKGYQSVMNAALRACMEAEQAAMKH